MTISVIVPAFNAQNTIGQTLKALQEQDLSDKFEIIVIDDGSVDQTAKIVQSFVGVRYLYQDNAGPAAARNHGARLAQGQILAFTDSDCIPHKNWLSSLMRGFVEKDVAVVMGSYGIANDKNLLAYCVYKEILFRHSRLLPEYPKVFGSYNFCVKREVFDQVGGFNELYRHASGEDNDLSYKIVSKGLRIYFDRQALVDHYHPVQIKKYLKEQFRHGYWRAVMYRKYPSMAAGDGYTFWKDALEVPWSFGCLLALFLSSLNFISYKALALFVLISFLIFEVLFAWVMLQDFLKCFFWGFVMFLRSFSRAFGLSTGFASFFRKNILNKY